MGQGKLESSKTNQWNGQITPKKKSQYSDQNSNKRIKSRLTIMKKPAQKNSQLIFTIFWVLLTIILIYVSYESKNTLLRIQAIAEKQQCQANYHRNRCLQPVKGLIQYCLDNKRCIQRDVQMVIRSKLQIGELIGHIVGQFCKGAGIVAMIGWIILIWIWAKNPNIQTRQIYEQFYQ